ncbi:MAG: MATE family efflux transporter [Ruminococcaceae bacterium]|nr:MATE family efflux transporter [Oscillospiraceae bacterium]
MRHTGAEQHERMTTTPIPKLVLSLAIPTVASQLVTVIYNTADTFFVSKLGNSASAAVGAVFPVMAFIQAFGFGIGMGASSLISRQLGAKKNSEAEKFAISALAFASLIGFVILLGGIFGMQPLMNLLGVSKTTLPYASDYCRIILWAAPIMCASFVLNNLLRAEGAAILSMIGLCTGGMLNIFLDPIFIFRMKMGISGAALATIISQIVGFTILLAAYLFGKSIIKLRISCISHSLGDYILLLRTGFPTIARQGIASFAGILLNNQVSPYGDAAASAIVSITNRIYMLMRNIVIGIGQGFQPVAGYNYGAEKYDRVRKAFRFSTVIGTLVCTLSAILVACFSETIVGWFRNDPSVIQIGVLSLLYCCSVTPLMAYSTYVNQLLQGLGFSKSATLLAMCRQGFCYLPLILLLPDWLGLTGVQLAQPAADLLTFLIAIPCQIHFMKKHLPNSNE